MTMNVHDALLRGEEFARILGRPIAIFGAGALGGNLVVALARMGFRALRVVDCDRVDDHNLGNQPYGAEDIGTLKVAALAHQVFRDTKSELVVLSRQILAPKGVARFADGVALCVDTFDNARSRMLVAEQCQARGVPCVHAGMAADSGAVEWNAGYTAVETEQRLGCNYPLARNLVQIMVAVLAEDIIHFLLTGERRGHWVSLRPLKIEELQ